MRSPSAESVVPLYGTEAYHIGIRRIAERNIGLQDQVADNANAAFKDTALKVVKAKPVAMQDEAGYIFTSLEALSEQGEVPHGFVLSCNAPVGTDDRLIQATKSEIERFTHSYPHVPLSYYDTWYAHGTTIGEIRNHNVGVGIGALCNRYGFRLPPDVFVVNADADTVAAPPRYIDRLYHAAMAAPHPEMAFVYPAMRNADSGGRFPNMDAVMAWTDMFAVYGEKYPEQHNAMGVGMYLAGREYDETCAYGETTELLGRARENAPGFVAERHIGPLAVTVSARHAYHQMRQGEQPHFGPVRSEHATYRSELSEGDDMRYAQAYNDIGMMCLAELPNIVAAQVVHVERSGYEGAAARLVAIERTRAIVETEVLKMGSPYQMLGAVEGQLDRMRDRIKQKVA